MLRDIDNLKQLMGVGLSQNQLDALQKALTASNLFVGYNLEPTAKLMLPLFAGFRNSLPVDKPKQGAPQATWRMQLGYGNAFGALGSAEANIGTNITGTAVSVSADYKSQAVNNSVTWEAMKFAEGWDDALAIATAQSLASLIRYDELLCLGGNEFAISAPVISTSASAGSGSGSLTINGNIYVTAVTLEGCEANKSSFLNTIGESAVSNVLAVNASGVAFIDIYWPVVAGAAGYKVYMGAGGSEYNLLPATQLKYKDGTAITAINVGQTWIGVNHLRVVAIASGTNAKPAGDSTVNPNAFEGTLAWCEKTTLYSQALGGTHFFKDMDGGTLTTIPSGIAEIDYILSGLWYQWKIGVSRIITGPKGVGKLTDVLINFPTVPLLRVDVSNERGGFTGGVYLGAYLNKFAASMLGNANAAIPVWAHPDFPEGNFLFLVDTIPYQYSQEARGWALDVQTPYTYFELARTSRLFPFSLFFTETLKCYHPLAQAFIAGCRVE